MALGPLEFIALPAEQNKQRLFPKFCRCILWHSITATLTIGIGVLLMSGCALPLAALSSAGVSSASTVGTAAGTAAMANPSTAVSMASTVTTGKSPLEHAASQATKKECNFLNFLGPKPVCEELVLPRVTDFSEAYLGEADRKPSMAPSR